MSSPTRGGAGIRRLAGPDSADAAAAVLRGRPEGWRQSARRAGCARSAAAQLRPGPELFELARDSDRDAMGRRCRGPASGARIRRTTANTRFLLKDFRRPMMGETWQDRSLAATSRRRQLRRYLVEALTQLRLRRGTPRLAHNWTTQSRRLRAATPRPALRRCRGRPPSCPLRRTEARRRLVKTLLADPDEGVLASALNAVDPKRLTGPEISPELSARSPITRRRVLLERRRTSAAPPQIELRCAERQSLSAGGQAPVEGPPGPGRQSR